MGWTNRSGRVRRALEAYDSVYGDVDLEGDVTVETRLLIAETEAWLDRIRS